MTTRSRTNLKASERHAQIRALLAEGQSDPTALAVSMGCTKALVLFYARRMPEVAMRSEQHGARGHFRISLGLAERAA